MKSYDATFGLGIIISIFATINYFIGTIENATYLLCLGIFSVLTANFYKKNRIMIKIINNKMIKKINPPKIHSDDSDYCSCMCPHFYSYNGSCTLFDQILRNNELDDYKRCPQCHEFTDLVKIEEQK